VRARVAVLGAGPAGLAAAWRAASAGHEVVVLDRAPVVGGMAGSFTVAGVRVDHGSHRLHPSIDPGILAALDDLLGPGGLQRRERRGRIRLAGRWVAFPLRAGDLVRHLPPRFAAGALAAPLRRGDDGSFAGVVRSRFGAAVADEFYGPYARKLWGRDAGELSADLARRRVSAGSATALAARVLRARRPEGRRFLYPAGGFGAIAEALAGAATAAGADVRLGAEVRSIRLGDAEAAVATADGGEVTADLVWSTLPLGALPRLVADPPPPPLPTVEVRGLALVYLVVDRPRWTPFDAHYFPGADVALSRLSEPRNYRDSPADPPDRTVLCAEVPCSVGDGTWSAGDGDLADRVLRDLAGQDLPPVRPVAVEVRRLPSVYPVATPDALWAVAALDAWANAHPRLVTLGRQGLVVGDNTHHVLAMGWAAAACLLPDGTYDRRAWAEARRRFRGHVVED
jgi:protoporphyrinogen oxidase